MKVERKLYFQLKCLNVSLTLLSVNHLQNHLDQAVCKWLGHLLNVVTPVILKLLMVVEYPLT